MSLVSPELLDPQKLPRPPRAHKHTHQRTYLHNWTHQSHPYHRHYQGSLVESWPYPAGSHNHSAGGTGGLPPYYSPSPPQSGWGLCGSSPPRTPSPMCCNNGTPSTLWTSPNTATSAATAKAAPNRTSSSNGSPSSPACRHSSNKSTYSPAWDMWRAAGWSSLLPASL